MAKHRKKKEPRGWMAPRNGGYTPRQYCKIHGYNTCGVWTRHCPGAPVITPPKGGGGVVVRKR